MKIIFRKNSESFRGNPLFFRHFSLMTKNKKKEIMTKYKVSGGRGRLSERVVFIGKMYRFFPDDVL